MQLKQTGITNIPNNKSTTQMGQEKSFKSKANNIF